jgi:hypothetical protein
MVQKIRKKTKKGPKASYAVPMVLVMTCLYGFKREGREFRAMLECPESLRTVLAGHFGQGVVLSERPLSKREYLEWGLRSEPGRLAEMFGRSGLIPMGPAVTEEDFGTSPRFGILPFLALVKGRDLEAFFQRDWPELSEVSRVALQNRLYPTFNLIPGYDLLLYPAPCHARQINAAIVSLNAILEAEFERGGIPIPEPFGLCTNQEIEGIPSYQPYSKRL